MRDFLQILKVQIVKMKPELAVPMRGRSDHDPSIAGTVSHPSAGQASLHIFRDTFCLAKHGISCIYYLSKTHFVRDFPQKVKVDPDLPRLLKQEDDRICLNYAILFKQSRRVFFEWLN